MTSFCHFDRRGEYLDRVLDTNRSGLVLWHVLPLHGSLIFCMYFIQHIFQEGKEKKSQAYVKQISK